MNGIIIADKPAGYTSFDIVAVMRKLTGEKKIGHTGTLDPMATGVLPLLLGRAAKAADLLSDTGKTYIAGFKAGMKTDTGDITGKTIDSTDCLPGKNLLAERIKSFEGEIYQLPPMYSAVSVNGQRLYKLARKGIEIDREKRKIFIYDIKLIGYSEVDGTGMIEVTCSKGTYIRTLIEDILSSTGSLGVMTSLRRTQACGFSESEAVTLDDLKDLSVKGEIEARVRPVDTLFFDYPEVVATSAQSVRFANGGSLDIDRLKIKDRSFDRFRIYSPDNVFLGLGETDKKRSAIKVLKLFHIGG